MTSWTKPRTWVAGQPLSAAALNTDLRDDMKNIDERLTLHGITSESALNKVKSALCGVRLTDAGSQTIATSTDTALTWDTETYDSDGFHSTSSNTERITIPAGLGGYYDISVSVRWEADGTVSRRLWVENQSGTILGRRVDLPPTSGIAHQTLTFPALLTAGSYIVAYVHQGTGGDLDVTKNGTATFFTAHRIFAV